MHTFRGELDLAKETLKSLEETENAERDSKLAEVRMPMESIAIFLCLDSITSELNYCGDIYASS